MSGLACGVLLPHRLDQEQEQELSALIDLDQCQPYAVEWAWMAPCIELELEVLSDVELIAQDCGRGISFRRCLVGRLTPSNGHLAFVLASKLACVHALRTRRIIRFSANLRFSLLSATAASSKTWPIVV